MKNWLVRLRSRGVGVLLGTVGIVLALWGAMFFVVPRPLFDDPCSTLLYSREGELLGARIAPDGQWRFPQADSLPEKFVACLVAFEDRRFFYHPGVDPLAMARAVWFNVRSRGVVSGGSTITMQLARLARGNRGRNLWEKAVESLWALHLETTHSKRSILALYASHAPFGGNVVGVETAAWRYFGRAAADLSWAESATLAVLPNAPALIHPGRNRDALKAKRDGLLLRLAERGTIDRETCELACMEPLPEAPVPLPNEAPHLLERLALRAPGTRIETALKASLQRRVQYTVNSYAQQYAANHVYNLAVVVADVETGETLAYAGNVSFPGDPRHGNSVDVVMAPRSTGSILKPLLYAGMLHDGLILPGTLIPDTPLNIAGFVPQNYDRSFRGAVPAREAIERSLNVPLVRMLSHYNTGRFMSLLKSYGMSTLRFSEEHYGASLILGGAEGTLWDIAGMYGSMARTLNHYQTYSGRYNPRDVRPLTPFVTPPDSDPIRSVADRRLSDRALLNAAAIWFACEAMSEVGRPEEEAEWQQFSSMKRVAWKTGTSWGGRDAWAVGFTPRYVVGVWVGNASGEGRPGLTGVRNAAPVLFDIFSMLPDGGWFRFPYDETERMAVCRRSGHKASPLCEPVDTLYMPLAGIATSLCPWHRQVHLSKDGRWRVNSSCEAVEAMVAASWFVLPPAQAWYYRHYHADYRSLPPLKPGCREPRENRIDIIYPEHNSILYLPRGFSGERERFVFRAAHERPDAVLYWHLNDTYLGETKRTHSIACAPEPGRHTLILIDERGDERRIAFEVM